MPDHAALTIFTARCGDRNPRGMAGAAVLGEALAERLDLAPARIGTPQAPPKRSPIRSDRKDAFFPWESGAGCDSNKSHPAPAAHWDVELAAALPELRRLADHLDAVLAAGRVPVTALGRCAAALGTLPSVARHRPDAAIVWFDAHGDCNEPVTSATGYLGGLVLTGAAGRWPTGVGDGLDLNHVVLVGARDIDPPEQALIGAGVIRLVAPGPDLPVRLGAAVAGRPVYIHLDCDVLEPGLVPTEYSVAGGLGFDDLRRACEVLAVSEFVGLEISEFEDRWEKTREPGSPAPLLAALEPLLERIG